MTKNLVTYRASAGSGKTYTLAVEFIALCLKVDDPGYFRKILAITFTNKAAEELKERILQFMQALSKAESTDPLMEKVISLTSSDASTINKRAEKAFTLMLFKYADLHVSTIDHFVLGILKAFSKELGLSFDFKVELDQGRITDLLIEELMKNIGRDRFITDAIVAYAISRLDEGSSWNPKNALADASDHLFKEHSAEALELLGAMDDETIASGMKELRSRMQSFKEEAINLKEQGLLALESQGLSLDDYEGKSRSVFNILFLDFEKKGFTISEALRAKIGTETGAHKSSKNKAAAETLSPLLMDLVEKIDSLCIEIRLLDSIYKDRLTLLLAKRLHGILKTLEKEEDISLISGNNQRIATVVKGNPAPFIYERLGERFKHFLIDEFQDTSLSQWHNFIPLLDNSLSMGNRNLIVGDAKQSIYRWRNSEVEQIISLPDIHKKEGDQELNRISAIFQREHQEKNLADNFRSSAAIVNFNNALFQANAPLLVPHLAKAYNDVKQVVKKTEREGYVELTFLDKGDKLEDALARTLAQISACTADGYQLGDIAILVRKNKEGQIIARYLESEGIQVNSSESLVLSGNDQVHLLLHLLQFVFQKERPKSDLFILEHLLQKLNRQAEFHSRALKYHKERSKVLLPLLKEIGFPLNIHLYEQENIYQAAERLCRETWIDDRDPYIQELLDLLYAHCKGSDASLDAFLEFFDRKTDLSIKASPNSNAVQLMTVHRSKGLQFPVVIIPFWKQKTPGRNPKKEWFSWEKVPFPKVPFTLSKKLIGSLFEEAYTTEQDLLLMDEINALYVASTRPEHRLYLNMLSTGSIQTKVMDLFSSQLDGFTYKSGIPEAIDKKVPPSENALPEKSQLTDPLKILRTTSKKDRPYAKAREFGEQVHQILERCDDEAELPTLIDLMTASLKMTVKERIELEKTVKAALAKEHDLGFKAQGFICLKEQEILSPDGKLNRLDRLYLNPALKAARILDYKTGHVRSNDDTQMRQYINLIQKMGYEDVKAFLLYTQDLKLVALD